MRYDKGDCIFTSYDTDGIQVGESIRSRQHIEVMLDDHHSDEALSSTHEYMQDSSFEGTITEYNLYNSAMTFYPQKPTAGFELLRFGRVIGDEPLQPENAIHLRQIPTATGNVWVNLNLSYIKKYSDADFPYWKGWGVVNDDNDGDGRCDSLIIGSILYSRTQQIKSDIASIPSGFGKQTPKDYQDGINSDMVQQSAMQFDDRYAWVKKDIFKNDNEKFSNFKEHVQSLAFWEEAGLKIDKNHWHFPPIEFIKYFRKCGWLSLNEMKQLIPSHNVANNGWAPVPYSKVSNDNLVVMYVNISKMLRKYCITTPLRMSAFFGNALQETRYLATLKEDDSQKAGTGKFARYAPWYGRGMLQLTWENNYSKYWKFRGWTVSVDQYGTYREYVIDSSRKDPSDSAGFYWVYQDYDRTVPNTYADELHDLERVMITGGHVYYCSKAFWKNAAGVNSPGHIDTPYKGINGFDSRCAVYGNALAILTEMKFPDAKGNKILEFPEGYRQRNINEKPQERKITPSHHKKLAKTKHHR